MLNQKKVLTIFSVLILLVSLAPVFVFADSHDTDNSDSGSGSGSDGSTDSDNSGSGSDSNSDSTTDRESDSDSGSDNEIDEAEDDKEEDDSDSSNLDSDRDRFKEETKREFRTADGKKVEVERKIEVEDGKRKIEIKRTITDADGSKREVKIKVEERDDGRRIVKIEGRERNISVDTRLEVETEAEGDESDVRVVDSRGVRHALDILPDRASDIARERLKINLERRASNITNITLEEIRDRNIPRVVYKVNSEHPGRFLGIIKLKLKAETNVDPETGEVVGVNVPWWAFLVTGDEIPDERPTDEATEEDTPTDSDEGIVESSSTDEEVI